jgi:hypothetical protein
MRLRAAAAVVLFFLPWEFGCAAARRPVLVRNCTAVGLMPENCSSHYIHYLKSSTIVTCERTVLIHAKFRIVSQEFTYRCCQK